MFPRWKTCATPIRARTSPPASPWTAAAAHGHRLSSTLARLLPQYDFAEPVIPYAAYDDFRSFRATAPYDLASLAISPRYAPKEADFIADVFREYITEV